MAWIKPSDLSKHFNSSGGQASLISSEQGQVVLKRQAERLRQCIINRINTDLYGSYSPVMYKRTYGLIDSLEVDNDVQVNIKNGMLQIEVAFSGDSAYHPSLYGAEDAYIPSLLNNGYSVKKDVWFKNIPYFGFRSGVHFIENGIKDWESGNTEGVFIVNKYNKY